MNVYLVQHGKAYDKEENSDRPLNTAGKEETSLTANQLLNNNIEVSKIIHSNKTRAIETARIIADTLNSDTVNSKITIEFCPGLNPNDNVEAFAEQLNNSSESTDNIMIVGHLPFLSKLLSQLVVGDKDIPIIEFRNSAVVCIKFENQKWLLQWIMTP